MKQAGTKSPPARIFAAAFAAVLMAAAACIQSPQPLFEDNDLVTESRLLGVWTDSQGQDSWGFERGREKEYRLVCRSAEEAEMIRSSISGPGEKRMPAAEPAAALIAARNTMTGLRRAAGIAGLAAVLLIVPPSSAQNHDSTGPSGALTRADKTELAEIFRLKTEVGDRVWPGFAKCGIPVVLYNDDFEFLVGSVDPPSPWVKVPGDDFARAPYHRRPGGRAQAFAIEVGGRWAGSISTLGRMNAKAPFKLPPDFHVVLALHEMFHAFQAARAPGRFARWAKVYAAEDRYPFKDLEFAVAWTSEGAALAKGMQAADRVAAAAAAREFLRIRDERRTKAGLAPDLLGFERELEWLEGLAKYAEIGFYEIAETLPPGPAGYRYKVPMLFIQSDYMRLGNGLGAQSGDLRFYLSGMAQARLLDRLSPGWKDKALPGPAFLEDLIREAVFPLPFPISRYCVKVGWRFLDLIRPSGPRSSPLSSETRPDP